MTAAIQTPTIVLGVAVAITLGACGTVRVRSDRFWIGHSRCATQPKRIG